MKAIFLSLMFVVLFVGVSYGASRTGEPEYKMGYYYYTLAVESYGFGNFKTAIDNYRLASAAFLNEGNDFMQRKSDEGLTKSRIKIQGN